MLGKVAKWKLDSDTSKAFDLQRQFIEDLIKENAQTEYGQRFGFGSRICTAEASSPRTAPNDCWLRATTGLSQGTPIDDLPTLRRLHATSS